MRPLLALVVLCACSGATVAQIVLPGATAPAPVGSVLAPDAGKPKAKPRVRRAEPVPGEANLAGKTLSLNGGKSQMAFTPRDRTVDLSRLLLDGSKISNGADECQVDVAGLPLAITQVAPTDGLPRFSIPIPACPITFDVLNGAVLVTGDTPKCTFKEADCQVAPGGLWGMAPGDIGAGEVKTIERERTQAEKNVRAAYKGLVGSTKDRATIRGFASDQAGFSSHREEICRDYIGESRHGFCATRLTQARAATLQAELVVATLAKEARKKAKDERRKKHGAGGKT